MVPEGKCISYLKRNGDKPEPSSSSSFSASASFRIAELSLAGASTHSDCNLKKKINEELKKSTISSIQINLNTGSCLAKNICSKIFALGFK